MSPSSRSLARRASGSVRTLTEGGLVGSGNDRRARPEAAEHEPTHRTIAGALLAAGLLAAVVSVIVLSRSREPRRGYFGEERAGAREQADADPSRPAGQKERDARA